MAKSESKMKSPLVFKWGTLCKAILNDEESRSLYDVKPNMRITMQKPEKDLEVRVGLGSLGAFAMFEKTSAYFGKPKDGYLTVKTNFVGFEPTDVWFDVAADHSHFHHSLKISQAIISIPAGAESGVFPYFLDYYYKSEFLGRIEFPVLVRFEEGGKSEQRKSSKETRKRSPSR